VPSPSVAVSQIRNLVVILGDQLSRSVAAWDGFDPSVDLVWMAEVSDESTRVPSSKQRTALFLAAMRHFAEELKADAVPLDYRELSPVGPPTTLAAELAATLADHKVERVIVTQPGEWGVLEALREAVGDVPFEVREDRHFLCSAEEFAEHAKGRKQLRMEFFYREMRRRHDCLMDGDQPVGGRWNFDSENRGSFGKAGPGSIPPSPRFEPDELTQSVIELVNARFADNPGELSAFGWPVTREQALQVLASFINERLKHFGKWQDAIWEGEPWLFHAHISSALNLKLLDPREVIAAAEAAWRDGRAPLEAVEGFIRQILGWREYARGIYWQSMPEYLEMNGLEANEDLPDWFWTGETPMACLSDAIGQTLKHGYAHHIQRLMVTGLYALLLGVEPEQVHRWYLSVYVDAVEWVELPNSLGMSQYADGGLMASKPYVATGRYIQRMSNHCSGCRFDPAKRTGETACPFTTLYWDFLMRHEQLLSSNPRMGLQIKNLARIGLDERDAIAQRAEAVRRDDFGI